MSTKNHDPSDPGSVLFGVTRGRLLAWLYAHPDERFYVRQLVRQTGSSAGAVQRELQLLARAGFVTRTAEGRQVYFQANQDIPIFLDLQQVLLKTVGAAGVIQQALADVAPQIDVAFLYGSSAKGSVRASSGIDVLIVGRLSFTEVVSALSGAQHELGRDLNPAVFSRVEFREKLRAGHHFLTTVLREPKVFIIGTDRDLSRLAEIRVAQSTPKQPPRNRRSSGSRRT